MFKRMLVLLDGSKLAEVVLSFAGELSGRLNLDLELLHVCSSHEAEQLPMHQAYIEHMADILRGQSEEIRHTTQPNTEVKLIQARGKVVVGYPAEEILKFADGNSIDIIMLATHGRSGIRRWGLGSVVDKVIHEAKVPIWLVPSQLSEDILYDTLPKRSVLIPLDGSKQAEAVIPYIEELTKQKGVETEILLIKVAKPSSVGFQISDENKTLIGENIAALRTAGEVYLDEMVKELKGAGLQARGEQLIGDPAEEIVRYAAKYHPQLIAMSTHGRSGFSRFAFGSVTENVMRRLQKTPLFLVRP